MSDNLPGRDRFQQSYEHQAPPWDIGHAQPVFVAAATKVHGSVLDVGCGTGENALFFAAQGHRVTGIDFVELAIEKAKHKAQERDLRATFFVMDVLHLKELPEVFDTVIDCGLFHVFSDSDRKQYLDGLKSVLKEGGTMLLMCFSDKEPPGDGPRRISQEEIRVAFAEGWSVETIEEARFEVRSDLEGIQFSDGGPIAWFCVIRRIA